MYVFRFLFFGEDRITIQEWNRTRSDFILWMSTKRMKTTIHWILLSLFCFEIDPSIIDYNSRSVSSLCFLIGILMHILTRQPTRTGIQVITGMSIIRSKEAIGDALEESHAVFLALVVVRLGPTAVGLVRAFFVFSEVVSRFEGIIFAKIGRRTGPTKRIRRRKTTMAVRHGGGHRGTVDKVATTRTAKTITTVNRTTRVHHGKSDKEREREEDGHEGTPVSCRLLLPTMVVVRAGTDRILGDEGNGNHRLIIIIIIVTPIRDGVVPVGMLLLERMIHGVPIRLLDSII